ncbi:MAG: GxxExxY protein [bacterium]|nr:GxxExxY protein [bacterium]
MKWDDTSYRSLTESIIASFYKVYDTLGPGFLENAYHRALYLELRKKHSVELEKEYKVIYEGEPVSTYIPDLVIENKVIIEVKSTDGISDIHKAQLLAQLRVSGLLIGFLVNFAKKDLEFRRYDNYFELKQLGLFIE